MIVPLSMTLIAEDTHTPLQPEASEHCLEQETGRGEGSTSHRQPFPHSPTSTLERRVTYYRKTIGPQDTDPSGLALDVGLLLVQQVAWNLSSQQLQSGSFLHRRSKEK